MWFIQLFGRIHSTICLRMQTANELMLCQLEAQVRTNKRYAILLEFLSDLCPAGFCLSVIPFISAIYRCNFYRKCCVGINKFLEYSGRERQSDSLTAFKLLSYVRTRTPSNLVRLIKIIFS